MATGNAVRIYASKSQGSLCSRVVAGASSVILVRFYVGGVHTLRKMGIWSSFDVFVPHIYDNIHVYEEFVEFCCHGNPTLIMRHSGQV